MNENTTKPVLAPSAQEVIELDLKDLLAELLLHWKKILLWMLAAAIIGVYFPKVKDAIGNKLVTEDSITAARAILSDPDAQEVESMIFQYKAYKAMQRDMEDYYTRLASVPLEEGGVVEMRSNYLLFSSLDNLGTSLASVLTEEDYDALRAISPDEEIGLRIYDRVKIITSVGSNGSASNNMTSNIYVSVQQNEDGVPNQYLITASLYGRTEAQCEEMMRVVDAALQRGFRSLQTLDPELVATTAGSEFDYNIFEHVNTLRKDSVDRVTGTSQELENLKNRLTTLKAEQRDYYQLLKNQYEQQFEKTVKTSMLKSVVIAVFLGGVLAVVAVFWHYLFDGTVKTAGELECAFCTAVLARIFVPEKKTLFDRWCSSLCEVDHTDPAEKVDVLAADLHILMSKAGKQKLYLLCAETDMVAANLADRLKLRLLQLQPEAEISIGNPLTSVAEIEKAGEAEFGVVFAELKQSKHLVLRQWRQLCGRYGLSLAGAVSVRRCWN